MSGLNIDANFVRPDDFYELLIEMHRDLTREESELVNCKLILLLANHVGDQGMLRDAMTRARQGVGTARDAGASPASPLESASRSASPEPEQRP